jgi:PKD repeat protein
MRQNIFISKFVLTCMVVLLFCATSVIATTVDKGESENGTFVTVWSHAYGYIWYHVYPIAPSPAVINLSGDTKMEVVSGNEEYYAKPGISGEWYCFNASGNILWTLNTTNDESRTSPVIADIDGDGDYEIAGSTTSGNQFQLINHTGNFLGRFAVENYNNNPASPALCDVLTQTGEGGSGEKEFIGASLNGILYCLDADPSDGIDDGLTDYYINYTGDQTDLLWKFETKGMAWQWVYDPATATWSYVYGEGPSKIFSAPAVSDINGDGIKEVIIGCDAGKVYNVRGTDGQKIWEYQTGGAVRSSAALYDADGDGQKEVFIGSQDRKVYCFLSTGTVKWSFLTGGTVDSSPTVADLDGDGNYELVVGSADKKVYCLDAKTGGLKWSVATNGAVLSSATPANRTGGRLDIYICSNDGFLYLINGATGAILDRFYAGAWIQSSPTVADIDGDGHLEVLFMDWAAEIGWSGDTLWCLRDMGSQVSAYQTEWPMFRGDASHTGVYTKTYTSSAQSLPTLTAQASPVSGEAPLTVNLSMTVTTPGSISKYEWDFDGNGTYDWTSVVSGDTTTTYTGVGNYSATARVTDNKGQIVVDSVKVVVVNAKTPPVASINANPTSGSTPLMVQLNGTGQDSDGQILLYEWDFDGDGNYDWTSTSSGQVAHNYSEAGTFTARLRVTDDDNLSDTAQVTINVQPANKPPIIQVNASPFSGDVPLAVVLTAVGNDEDGQIALWEWDFDGDGNYDWSSDSSELSGTTTHTYTEVGTYNATARATDDDGLTTTASTQVVVSSSSDFKVWISKPKTGTSLSGSAVSIRAQTAPGASATDHVKIEWRKQGDSAWQNITDIYPPPYSFYDTTFDVTGFNNGQVLDLRAVGYHVDGSTTAVSPIITVSVDNTDPDVEEAPNSQGEHHKKEKVSMSYDNEVVVNGGISITVDYGTLQADTHLEITVKNKNPFPANGASVEEAGSFVDIELVDVESFNKSLTITLSYQDADNDGIEDTTGTPEKKIKMYAFDEAKGLWEVLPNNSVNAAENTITAKTPHLSNFGLFALKDVSTPNIPSGGGGGCFINTVTYNNNMTGEVKLMSQIKDRYFMSNRLSRAFVSLYYKISPVISKWIGNFK